MASGAEVMGAGGGPIGTGASLGAVDVGCVRVVHANVHVADGRLIIANTRCEISMRR